MEDSAVIVNELGEIGIDHALVETAFEDAVLMRSGCLCCTLRGDLVDTLCELGRRVDDGELPSFVRVLVETTGIADPGPILRTLLSEPLITARYRAGLVVATVDALHATGRHGAQVEFARQVAVADRIVLTKTDLAPERERERTQRLLRRLNPAARVLEVVSGRRSSRRSSWGHRPVRRMPAPRAWRAGPHCAGGAWITDPKSTRMPAT